MILMEIKLLIQVMSNYFGGMVRKIKKLDKLLVVKIQCIRLP